MSNYKEHFHHLFEKDNPITKWIIFGLFVAIVALLFPRGESVESEYSIGTVWVENDFYAPFAFAINKDEGEYERQRAESVRKVYTVFEENPAIAKSSLDTLQLFFLHLKEKLDGKGSSAILDQLVKRYSVTLTENEWNILWKLRAVEKHGVNETLPNQPFERLRRDVLLVVNGLYLQGVLDVRKAQFENDSLIAVRKKTVERIAPINNFIDRDEVAKIIEQTFVSGYRKDNDTISVATKIALSFLMPNVVYQKEQTEREKQYAADFIPRTIGAVREGERIIGKNERISSETKHKLDALRKAKAERGAEVNRLTTYIGKVIHVVAIVWLISMYVYLFRKKIFHDNSKLLLIAVLLLLVCVSAYATVNIETNLPIKFLIIVPAVSMLLGIVFDSRVAFYSTVVMAFLVAGIRGNDYTIALYSLVAGSMTVYTVRDIKERTQIFRSITFIFVGYTISILAISLERYDSLSVIIERILYAGVNAVISPLITYGLFIFLERTFHITTDLTYLELSDYDQPLLKELSIKAPGTFHHSVTMATLAETAAKAIGANETIARVGALYHDIGKVVNPAMFVENQLGEENKHQRYSPKKSAKIIASHIEDGVEIARQYKIPEEVIDFIVMHHGTTKVGFFYELALEDGKEGVNEKDFRYAGPRPHSKETAIVMLADAIEASTRSIEEPTTEKIRINIDAIINARMKEGEMDECKLTLQDIAQIRESFASVLAGIHHSRIKYPDQKEENENNEVVVTEEPRVKTKRVRAAKAAGEKRLQKRIDDIDTP